MSYRIIATALRTAEIRDESDKVIASGPLSAMCAAYRLFANSSYVPMAEKLVNRNGGERCDMLIGPCACGAWHNDDDHA